MMRNAGERATELSGREPIRIQSVGRAARLLLLIAGAATDGSCKSLAAAAGLAVPTAHHLLGTLVDEGLLTREANARYALGPKVALLAHAYQSELAVPDYLLGPLERLAITTGETAYLAAWRAGTIRILGVVEGSLPVRVAVPIAGPYNDAHARASGKLLLAYASNGERERYLAVNPLRALTVHTIVDIDHLQRELARIRANGLAIDEEEFLDSVSCISAPVLHSGVLIATYSMSLPTHRFAQRRDELISALLALVRSVEVAVGDGNRQPTVVGS